MRTADTISFQDEELGEELISFGDTDGLGKRSDRNTDDTHVAAAAVGGSGAGSGGGGGGGSGGGGDMLSDADLELDDSLHGLDSTFLELHNAREYAFEVRQAQDVLIAAVPDEQQPQPQQPTPPSTSPAIPTVGTDVIEDLLGLGLGPSSSPDTSSAPRDGFGRESESGVDAGLESGIEAEGAGLERAESATFLESALDGGMVTIDGQKKHHLAVAWENNLLSMVRGAQAATATALGQGQGQGQIQEQGQGLGKLKSELNDADGATTTTPAPGVAVPPFPEDSKKSGANANANANATMTMRNRVISARAQAKERLFQSWVKMRQGILLERVDTEKARLARTVRALQLASEATDKFWTKLRRKIESEYLDDGHACQWKLGVAHEGFFPGRRRVVLRPRFDVGPAETGTRDDDDVDGDHNNEDGIDHLDDGEWHNQKGKDPSPRTSNKRRSSMGASSSSTDEIELSRVGGLSIEDMASPEGTERLKLGQYPPSPPPPPPYTHTHTHSSIYVNLQLPLQLSL